MDISSTLSNTGSKQTVLEESSITFASLEEAKKRENDAISNERIKKGDLILDTYEVISDAISGGMGSVWRVHHKSWNTDLAMKRPQPKFFAEGSGKRKEQFIAECENWINLGLHPNIVSCYYVREIGGVPSIFSEWMDGGSLKDRIQDGSLYEGTEEEIQERILDIAIQAARGLQYSHENGLIHQDMKPGNLLLSKGWDAKVADFGLAKAKEQLDDDLETAKTTGYTLAYCPKEQSEGEAPEKWMDVYAWALTVLEMYAGKRLWNTGAEAKDHIDKYWQRCEYAVPDKMQVILNTCLTEKPDDFDYVVNKTVIAYCDVTEIEYPRQSFTGVTVSAEFLNNKALSFLDLKKSEEAEKCWELALENNSNHVESIYNELIYRWKRGEITDVEVLKRIRNADDGSIAAMMYQLQIQIARCDKLAYRCIEIIQKDRNLQPNSPEAKELNRLIRICDEIICESHSNVETVADSEYHPKMALSSIRSYEEQLRYDNEFSSLLQSAAQEFIKGDKKEAVRRIDSAMRIIGHFKDPKALDLRREYVRCLYGSVFDRVLTVNRYVMTDDDKWYVVSDEKAQSIIEVLKQISPSAAGEDTLAKYSEITVNSLSLKNTVIATQFPDIYLVTGRGINRFEHPRYGDEMLQSGSWVAVIDIKRNKIILRVSADDLGKPQCFAGERIPGNLFDVSEPVAVAVSNNGADCVISCSENKLFSQTLCTSKEFENVDMEYILPTISDDYFIFVGKKRIAIAYMTKDQFRIKWEIGSEREFSLLGFNRLNSTLTIAAKGSKPVTYEILWNFEEPSMDSGIVEWDDLDYHGPIKRRSSYF